MRAFVPICSLWPGRPRSRAVTGHDLARTSWLKDGVARLRASARSVLGWPRQPPLESSLDTLVPSRTRPPSQRG